MPPSAKRWTPPSILPIPTMLGNADKGENTNGLIRQYVPKGTALDTLSQAQIHHIMERLNHRPRKGLAFQTPYEILSKETDVQPEHFKIALTR